MHSFPWKLVASVCERRLHLCEHISFKRSTRRLLQGMYGVEVQKGSMDTLGPLADET